MLQLDPILAQGAGVAIEDAALLAHSLVSGIAATEAPTSGSQDTGWMGHFLGSKPTRIEDISSKKAGKVDLQKALKLYEQNR